MNITHSYEGLGTEYFKNRKGTPSFATFMIKHAGLNNYNNSFLNIVEFGIGSGQQTEFVEKELNSNGFPPYRIIAFDKSFIQNSENSFGQFNILKERLKTGELSNNVIPINYNFDGTLLPLKSECVHLSYMAHVLHHIEEKEYMLEEIARVTRKKGRYFNLGVTIEDLKEHPLDEFFPTKYKYDLKRYPTEEQLRNMYYSAGFTYEKPYQIRKDHINLMDKAFLLSVENTTIDSALKMIKEDDPSAFQEGVEKVKKEVVKAEKSSTYRTYFTTVRRVFWGVKK